jgi:hypothetical protein
VAFWDVVSRDVGGLGDGLPANDLAALPLWHNLRPPDPIGARWTELRRTLVRRNEDWDVWIDWYERILAGRKPLSEEIELYRVTLDGEDDWKLPPAEINAKIKAKIREVEARKQPLDTKAIAEALPDVAPPVPDSLRRRPATIDPIVQDGRLVLPVRPAEMSLESSIVVASLRALRETARELAAEIAAERQVDQRPARRLTDVADRIGDAAPTHDTVFLLGHLLEELNGFAATVNAEWPDYLAARYLAVQLNLDRTLRRFPQWRAYLDDPGRARVTPEERELAPALAVDVAAAARASETVDRIDPAIPNLLDILAGLLAAARAQGEQADAEVTLGGDRLAADLLESIDNILKTLAEAALVAKAAASRHLGPLWDDYRSAAYAGLRKEVSRLGTATAPLFTKAFAHVATAVIGGQAAAVLSAGRFGWLEAALIALGCTVGGSKVVGGLRKTGKSTTDSDADP